MGASFTPTVSSVTVTLHAGCLALASVAQGLYTSFVAGWGGWTFLGGGDRMLGVILGGYGLFRVVTFLVGALGALLVLLSANSLRLQHRRFVLLGGLTALGLPFGMLMVDMMTFNCFSLWYLPALTAIPAAVMLFEALPHLPPAPPREEW